jgi:hypothetical protein
MPPAVNSRRHPFVWSMILSKKRIIGSKSVKTAKELRDIKNEEMYKAVETMVYMTVDDGSDAVYLASMLLTTARNIFLERAGKERTIAVLETMLHSIRGDEVF